MFSYQCRYCKASFDHWEKLVKHRTETHRKEFEALKEAASKFAQKLPGNMESNPSPRCDWIHTLSRKGLPVASNDSVITNSGLNLKSAPRKTPSTKEVNAKDLQNYEIRLCVPPIPPSPAGTSSNNIKKSGTQGPSAFSGVLSPPASPCLSRFRVGLYRSATPPNSSYLTPPISPSPTSSLNEEMVLSMNWVVPISNKIVMYHEINDSDEIEICVAPSLTTGSKISVTRHSFPEMLNQDQNLNNETHSEEMNHVVVEELEDELQMTCSSVGNAKGPFSASNGNRFGNRTTTRNNQVQMKSVQQNVDRSHKPTPSAALNNAGSVKNGKRVKVNGKAILKRRVFAHKSFRNSSKLRFASRASLQRSRFKHTISLV